MNFNNEYVMIETWQEKLKKYVKSFYKTIFLGTPIILLLNIPFSFSFTADYHINFFALFIPISIGTTAFCIYFPLKAIDRYKTIVKSFHLENEKQLKLILIDGQVIIIPDFKIDNTIFKVGNKDLSSKLIRSEFNNIGYIIIPSFFSNLPTILN